MCAWLLSIEFCGQAKLGENEKKRKVPVTNYNAKESIPQLQPHTHTHVFWLDVSDIHFEPTLHFSSCFFLTPSSIVFGLFESIIADATQKLSCKWSHNRIGSGSGSSNGWIKPPKLTLTLVLARHQGSLASWTVRPQCFFSCRWSVKQEKKEKEKKEKEWKVGKVGNSRTITI